MSKHFTLEIQLGNDAMQTAEDIAEALTSAAVSVSNQAVPAPMYGQHGSIFDVNGNVVGRWAITRRNRRA